jgi:hypothetical protein
MQVVLAFGVQGDDTAFFIFESLEAGYQLGPGFYVSVIRVFQLLSIAPIIL